MKKARILLTGGGTGGHIYPLLAVAAELRRIAAAGNVSIDVRYFGGAEEYAEAVKAAGIGFSKIISGKIRAYFSIWNLLDLPKFFLGWIQALWKIFWFRPDAAFSKGGPGALPVLLACRFYSIPIAIHESDSIPGKTNLYSGKIAEKIFISFESAKNFFRNKNKVLLAGNPVRPDLLDFDKSLSGNQLKSAAKQSFGLNPGLPVLLVLGGSQGATRINDAILASLEPLLRQAQIIHQVGRKNYNEYKKMVEIKMRNLPEQLKKQYHFQPLFNAGRLKTAYLAADLALSRAGAGSIFELAAFGKPAILVPLPEAANNHQKENARQYAGAGAALVMEQEDCFGNLVSQISVLLKNSSLLEKMASAAKNFYRPLAAQTIAKEILKIALT